MKLLSRIFKKKTVSTTDVGITLDENYKLEGISHKLKDTTVENTSGVVPSEQEENTELKIIKEVIESKFVPPTPSHEAYGTQQPFQMFFRLQEHMPQLKNTMPSHLGSQVLQLEEHMKKMEINIVKVEETVPAFHLEAEKLRSDILLFTKAVSEAAAKYKLSPDWEGKKMPLMNLQKSLEERRAIYEQNNEKIEQLLEYVYHEYEAQYALLQEYCEYLYKYSQCLEGKITS